MMKLAKMLGIGAALVTAACAGAGESGSAEEGNVEAVGTAEDALSSQIMQTNEYLFNNQRLFSANCGFSVGMETNGNLVVRDRNNGAVWSSGTLGNPGAWAAMQGDGNFAIYPRDGGGPGTALWSTQTGSGVRLKMQSDSNLILIATNVSSDGVPVWMSGTVRPKTGDCSIPKMSEVTLVQNNSRRANVTSGGSTSSSKGACGSACAMDPTCQTWTFGAGKCWLRGAVQAPETLSGFTSGIKNKLCNGTGCPL